MGLVTIFPSFQVLTQQKFEAGSILYRQFLGLDDSFKFFDSLAAGRPVIVNMPGWLQEVVEEG